MVLAGYIGRWSSLCTLRLRSVSLGSSDWERTGNGGEGAALSAASAAASGPASAGGSPLSNTSELLLVAMIAAPALVYVDLAFSTIDLSQAVFFRNPMLGEMLLALVAALGRRASSSSNAGVGAVEAMPAATLVVSGAGELPVQASSSSGGGSSNVALETSLREKASECGVHLALEPGGGRGSR